MKPRPRLRLVRGTRVRIPPDQLAHFATPKTWSEIFALDPARPKADWRAAIVDIDEAGLRLLRWMRGTPSRKGRARTGAPEPTPGMWVLTDKGRAYVARASRR